jgi:hypothetical protein
MAGLNLTGSGEKLSGGPLTIAGGNDNNRLNGATLRILGSAVWDASSRVLFGNGSRVINEAGSVFEIRNNLPLEQWFGPVSTFENQGTLRKSAGTGVSTIGMIYEGDGALEVWTGTLLLNQGGMLSGSLETLPGTTARLNGGTFTFAATSRVHGDGTLQASAGTVNLGGEWTHDGPLVIDGGTVNVNTNTTFAAVSGGPSGVLGGTDRATIAGPFSMAGLNLVGGGEKISEGLLTISGNNDNNRLNGSTLRVVGSAVWNASTRILVGNGSRIINETGSMFDIQNDLPLAQWTGAVSTFENHGTLRKGGGGGTSTLQMHLVNDGTVEARSGTLHFTQSYLQTSGDTLVGDAVLSSAQALDLRGGRLVGRGILAGSVSGHVQLEPGLSTGILGVSGDYTMGSNHVFVAEIGGATAGREYDQVAVGGSVTLDGTLQVDFTGFSPVVDDQFTIMTWGTVAGSFDATNIVAGAGLDLDVQISTTGMVVRVVGIGTGDAPEPNGFTGIASWPDSGSESFLSSQPSEMLTPITLLWQAEPQVTFRIEWSTGLDEWIPLDADPIELAPGTYSATVFVPATPGPRMFRYRHLSPP